MRTHNATLALATVILALPLSMSAQSQQNATQQYGNQEYATGQNGTNPHADAKQMVPLNAELTRALDAKKDSPGTPVEAKVSQTVHLENGTELSSGSTLIGKVTQDDMQQQGMSKLALRFDQVRLKDGQTVPIRSTIVGIFGPTLEPGDTSGENTTANLPSTWTPGTLEVDQIGVLPGVDLHSKIGSQASGVLVTTKKDDVKLQKGSVVQLAVAPVAAQTNAGGQ